MEDSKIIELFLADPERAVTRLSCKYGRSCRKIAFNILNNPEEAGECVNEACSDLRNGTFKQISDPLSTYIFRITRKKALKRYHSNMAKQGKRFYDIVLSELEECIPFPGQNTDICTEDELTGYIEDFLDMQRKRKRIMFVKRYWYAEPVKAIAEEFGMTERRTSAKLRRIRRKLKAYLEKRGVIL